MLGIGSERQGRFSSPDRCRIDKALKESMSVKTSSITSKCGCSETCRFHALFSVFEKLNGSIFIVQIKETPSCSCEDFCTNGTICKHIYFIYLNELGFSAQSCILSQRELPEHELRAMWQWIETHEIPMRHNFRAMPNQCQNKPLLRKPQGSYPPLIVISQKSQNNSKSLQLTDMNSQSRSKNAAHCIRYGESRQLLQLGHRLHPRDSIHRRTEVCFRTDRSHLHLCKRKLFSPQHDKQRDEPKTGICRRRQVTFAEPVITSAILYEVQSPS